jgi:hypothetical protein
VDTDHQWADIFTKPLAEDWLMFILKNLKMEFCPEWSFHQNFWTMILLLSSEGIQVRSKFDQKMITLWYSFWLWSQDIKTCASNTSSRVLLGKVFYNDYHH